MFVVKRRTPYGTQVNKRLRDRLGNKKAVLSFPKQAKSRTRARWVITLQQKANRSRLHRGLI